MFILNEKNPLPLRGAVVDALCCDQGVACVELSCLCTDNAHVKLKTSIVFEQALCCVFIMKSSHQ